MDSRKDEALKVAREYFEKASLVMDIDQVWVFGSRIREDATKESDLDVAVVSREFDEDYFGATEKANLVFLEFDTNFDVELHGLGLRRFLEGGLFVDDIKRTGIRVSL